VNSHQIFALLLLHNVRQRQWSGPIVKSVSTTQLLDRICQKLGLPLIETPIGFKHISKELQKNNALMGGEESGGISLREHVHERDGVLNGLLLLEAMTMQKKSIEELIADMEAEFGKFYFERRDYHLNDEHVASIKNSLANNHSNISEIGGVPVKRYNDMDGTKFIFEDDSWLLVRASGTEPLLRVYSEATSLARVIALLDFAERAYRLRG
jgi:phosphomannomutase